MRTEKKMNTVDSLLTKPFKVLPWEEQLEVMRLGPHHPRDIKIIQTKRDQNRSFCTTWFDRKPWLTVSETLKTLFCFPCLLFGSESSWSKYGVNDLKHLSERIRKHENSPTHAENVLQLQMMRNENFPLQPDEGSRVFSNSHDEQVDRNRRILAKIISCIKFCGCSELPLLDYEDVVSSLNPGVFLNLVELLASMDAELATHLASATVFKGTCKVIQDELLDCMYNVYREQIASETSSTNFVSVLVDSASNSQGRRHLVVSLRYIFNGIVVERFHSFVEGSDGTSEDLLSTMKTILDPLGLKDKLIAQTYDGACVSSSELRNMHRKLKSEYPCAHLVHCYTHHMNVVVEQVCSALLPIKQFFAHVSAFREFFAFADVLSTFEEVRKAKPSGPESNGCSFKTKVLDAIYQNQDTIRECLEKMQSEGRRTGIIVHQMDTLLRLLDDEEFTFYLNFFHAVMLQVDVFSGILQKRGITGVGVAQALGSFLSTIEEIAKKYKDRCAAVENDVSTKPSKRRRVDKTETVLEACKLISSHAKDRFGETQHLTAFQLVDPQFFHKFLQKFPDEALEVALDLYPMLCKEKLCSELTVLYGTQDFAGIQDTISLLKLLNVNNLRCAFSETVKLLEVAITTPVTTGEPARCFSTLKRAKNFLHVTKMRQRLNALGMLSIEREFVTNTPDFNRRIIDKFAFQDNRKADFLFT